MAAHQTLQRIPSHFPRAFSLLLFPLAIIASTSILSNLSTPKLQLNLRTNSISPSPFFNCSISKMRREMSITAVAIFVVVLMAVDAKGAEAPPAVDCSTLVLGMSDCLTYVTNGSTVAKPEGQCCAGLKTVLRTDAQCLCDAFKNSASFGVSLNLTKALALPAACDVTTPSAKNCGVTLSPTTAPAVSPAGARESSIANSPGGSVGASEVASPAPVPTPGGKNASPMLGVPLGTWVLACLIGAIFFLASEHSS